MSSMQMLLKNKIEQNLLPAHLEIENESHKHSSGLGAESHFKVLIVSEKFSGLNRVKRQQMVYGLFAEEMRSGIHALSLRLLTNEEWVQGAADGFQTPNCHSKKN